jgi:hypothetical protein
MSKHIFETLIEDKPQNLPLNTCWPRNINLSFSSAFKVMKNIYVINNKILK